MTHKAIQKAIHWYLLTLVTQRKVKSLILTLPTEILNKKIDQPDHPGHHHAD